uniref:Transposase n=1 Tax=Heterorhabditis bacteriophora TaxID=37862 RepID=A0A1I7WRA7_HETBA
MKGLVFFHYQNQCLLCEVKHAASSNINKLYILIKRHLKKKTFASTLEMPQGMKRFVNVNERIALLKNACYYFGVI